MSNHWHSTSAQTTEHWERHICHLQAKANNCILVNAQIAKGLEAPQMAQLLLLDRGRRAVKGKQYLGTKVSAITHLTWQNFGNCVDFIDHLGREISERFKLMGRAEYDLDCF